MITSLRTTIEVATERPFHLLDLTDLVDAQVQRSGVGDGTVHVWCPHTSCGLAVTELEDGLHADVEAMLERLAPVDAPYAHDDMARRSQNLEPDERRNGWSHMRGLLATLPFVLAPVEGGRLALGRWQRLFLVELDGPRPRRTVQVQAWGNPA
ncbi:MAG TPA: secondary thiamine-phosphate synthase enzyme YjbQ [Acidimicrobiales bacterium]|nr:secondary thiamine-phosphate synthase enzyme YjbQ [Acidimicrobiales bacterium]